MTSPRQRKKYAAFLRQKEKEEKATVVDAPVVEPVKTKIEKTVEPLKVEQPVVAQKIEVPVAAEPPSMVQSGIAAKAKKSKAGLVELKSQDQVVEQQKEEVNTSTGE